MIWWLSFGLFMLHELEEVALIKPWVQRQLARPVNSALDRNPFFRRYQNAPGEVAALMIIEETILVIAIYAIAWWVTTATLAALLAVHCLHLAGHLIESLRLRQYTPGAVTAALTLPPNIVFVAQAASNQPPTSVLGWTLTLAIALVLNFRLIFALEPPAARALTGFTASH